MFFFSCVVVVPFYTWGKENRTGNKAFFVFYPISEATKPTIFGSDVAKQLTLMQANPQILSFPPPRSLMQVGKDKSYNRQPRYINVAVGVRMNNFSHFSTLKSKQFNFYKFFFSFFFLSSFAAIASIANAAGKIISLTLHSFCRLYQCEFFHIHLFCDIIIKFLASYYFPSGYSVCHLCKIHFSSQTT